MHKDVAAGTNVPQLWRMNNISLKNKIIFLTCISVLLSTLLVGSINYYRLEKIVLDTAVEKLAGETRLMAQRFKFSYDLMKGDVQVLSQTPPVQGIIRSLSENNIDPLDGSSTREWSQRLGTIFASMMAARPHYIQIRYIGIGDQGRELVRVNRGASGVELVANEDLQQKGQEPYFAVGLKAARGEVHFSEVNYNRERGDLDSSLIPTVRALVPVFDDKDQIFGMLVINTNYAEMLHSNLEEIRPQENTFIVNNSGDYMEHTKDGKIASFEFHDNYTVPPPGFVNEIVKSSSNEETFISDNAVSYFVRLNVDPNNPDAFLGIVVRVPIEELLRTATEARTTSLIFGGLLVLGCLVASLVLARMFTAPLNEMTEEIKQSSGNKKLKNLPLERGDEIGDLARAFDQKTIELATNEATMAAIVDNTIDGILSIDEHGTVETFNRACEAIFGYSSEEVIGRNVKMLMPDPYHREHDGYLKNYHRTGERKIIGTGREVEGRRKDGDVFPMQLSVSGVDIGSRKIYSGVVRDISESRQMEIMKDEFISTVNHELRTPLTSIQGSLGLLMAKVVRDDPVKSQKLLQISYENCQRLTRLVNDILDIEKIAAGKMDYQLEVVEIGQLVRDIVESQHSFAEKYNVEFKLQSDLPKVFVDLDQDRFNQALINLLSNAAKFSQSGGVVEIGITRKSAYEVIISVRDHGLGISKSFHSKIFEKFAQEDGSSTRRKGGSGLGLNITRKIIESFDGTVNFESEEGVGSVFSFTLPICAANKMRA